MQSKQVVYTQEQLNKIYEMIKKTNKEAEEKNFPGIYATTTSADKKPLKFTSKIVDKKGEKFDVYNANFDVYDKEQKLAFRITFTKNYNVFSIEEIRAIQHLLKDFEYIKQFVGDNGYVRKDEKTGWTNIVSFVNSFQYKKEIVETLKKLELSKLDKKELEKPQVEKKTIKKVEKTQSLF